MNRGKYVFSQVVSFIPARMFDPCVARYNGNKWIKHFSCWNQLLCMMYGQLSGRESLRDVLTCLHAHKPKYYHLGFGTNVSRSNLARANERRDWRIFEEFAMAIIALVRQRCAPTSEILKDITGTVYAFDSTTIDVCLNAFCWATFRRAKGAVKLHTLYEVRTALPTFIHVTPGSVNDVRALDELVVEAGAYYLLDRAYIDFERLHTIHERKAYFITRAKSNLQAVRKSSSPKDRKIGVISDQVIRLTGPKSSQRYPIPMRKIRFRDHEQERTFVFLTNQFDLPPEQIALLYKHRWGVELFFKWIKQHLKINAFWGRTENAVKTQVFIAIATYALVALIKEELKLKRSNYEILQIIGTSLLDRASLRDILKADIPVNNESQLTLEFQRC